MSTGKLHVVEDFVVDFNPFGLNCTLGKSGIAALSGVMIWTPDRVKIGITKTQANLCAIATDLAVVFVQSIKTKVCLVMDYKELN